MANLINEAALKRGKGRPRDHQAHQSILASTLKTLASMGFRSLTIDQIAFEAKVGKMTIYRWWPNKASLVMDAFLAVVGPGTEFPEAKTVIARIEKQLFLQAQFFSGEYGAIISTLIGEAQFDEELATAFKERWLLPRRLMTRRILELGVETGELKIGNYDFAIDSLYGAFYYRLMLKNAPLDKKFETSVLASWLSTFAIDKRF